MTRAWPICLGLACLLLGGCGSLPPRQDEAVAPVLPANWSNAEASPRATSLAQWWTRFDDPLLGQLVAQALSANTEVEAARAGLRQARALRDVAAAGLWPSLTGSASARRGMAGGDSTGNVFNVGLDASWEPDVFGGKHSAVDAGDANVRAGAAGLGDVQVSIAAEVALAYIALRGAEARLVIAEDNLASQFDTLDITQWRYQAGLVSALEAEQAQGATEQTQAQLPSLRTGIAETRHALAVLTGQAPAAVSALLAATRPIPQAADDLALSFPAQTLRQRPDVRAAEHRLAAALARVEQADAARKPRFDIGGSLGLNALTLGALSDGASVVGSLLAGISLPIFDAGAARANLRAEQAALDQARAAYRGAVLNALREVENALVALRGDRERLLRLSRAASAAGNAATLARQLYDSGLADFQVVLETQRSRLGAEDSVAATRADLSADHVNLYKALGGGWQPDEIDAPNRTPRS